MAGGDMSGCLEMTTGYGNFFRFNSGKIGVSWDCTGGTTERIYGKDPTTDATNQAFYLEYAQLTCASGSAAYYDGSAGSLLLQIMVSDVSPSGCNNSVWDFRPDALACLTADGTQSICVSAANGHVSGFIKGYWGPKPR